MLCLLKYNTPTRSFNTVLLTSVTHMYIHMHQLCPDSLLADFLFFLQASIILRTLFCHAHLPLAQNPRYTMMLRCLLLVPWVFSSLPWAWTTTSTSSTPRPTTPHFDPFYKVK